jgi:hypothetical protein
MKKDKLKVVFRYDKKANFTTMFFYDDRKNIECFTMSEGHNSACYNYYLSCKLITDIENNRDVQTIIKYYESYPNSTKLDIMKRLVI